MNFLSLFMPRRKVRKPSVPELSKRSFEAAVRDRLHNFGADIGTESIDKDIHRSLSTLRSLARDLDQNNDYIKRYHSLLKTHVIGPQGIKLQCNFKSATGEIETATCEMIEAAFALWSSRGCEVTGKYSFTEVQRLIIQSVARDGEALVRLVTSDHNPCHFSLQLIDPMVLDETLNDESGKALGANGPIKMGIEFDEWGAPCAYYLKTSGSGDDVYRVNDTKYLRIEAKNIIHVFRPDRVNQSRGVPWCTTAIKRLKQLQAYEMAELISARVASSKMGFFKRTSLEAKYEGDDLEQDDDGNYITEAQPGSFEILPNGVEFQAWAPEHPAGNYQHFVKATLRGIAAGLGVSYNSLAVDLESVNYSSLRSGLLEERDFYKTTQEWFIDAFMRPVYERWLSSAVLSGQVRLSAREIERYKYPSFLPRRWSWVDPLKDVNAAILSISAGLKSRSEVASEQGRSIEDIFSDLEREEKIISAKKLNINLSGGPQDDNADN